ncbi:MAG: response regulator [Oscillospiraceae bacterium]|jgi:DNA-binding response OmpR family regulator|nr:response regulator [Oscillospiraceae bacterium]
MEIKDTVLLVDDDPAFLKTVNDALREAYTVSFAVSGAEALELAAAGHVPDIILLDVAMPGMDGYETLEKLRELEDMQDVPVVFLSSMSAPESELRGIESGAMDYIKKPFVRDLLLARVRRHLENGRRLRQLSIMEKNKLETGIDEEKFRQAAAGLSETERKLLRLIVLGYSNREIGEALHYSYDYVKRVVSMIYEKKFVSTRGELKKLLR